jgi:hypothetical protein
VDAGGRYLAPGFLDVQVNGGYGVDYSDAALTAEEVARVGGALLAHTSRLAKRLLSFGLTFHQATTADEVWLAEHRAGLPTGRAEKWYTLVVVRVPGASLPRASGGITSATALDQALPVLKAWPHGGDVDIEGDVVRWRRQGLLWPWNVAQTIAQGRELAALVRTARA